MANRMADAVLPTGRPYRREILKNVVLIHADQLRFDGLTLNGAPEGLTPNIDRLARDGYNMTRHMAANPVCMPSRASLFTGLYPSGHGVWANGVPLNRSCYNPADTDTTHKHSPNFNPCIEPATLADMFASAGYHTTSLGKLHFTPVLAPASYGFEESYELWRTGKLDDWTGPYYGFEHVELAQGHGEFPVTEGGHYANWLKQQDRGVYDDVMAGKRHTQPVPGKNDLYLSVIPSELHNSTWLARRFCETLDQLQPGQPFFTFVGFPDPHHPFAPPADALETVADMPLPEVLDPEGGTDSMPLQQARGNRPGLEANREVRDLVQRYTLAMIRLMDDAVGRMIDKLEQLGLLEDTVIAFTADHGDFLGDHGLCYKNLFACRSLLHVPFVMHVPGTGQHVRWDGPMSNADVMPTLASLAGVTPPAWQQGRNVFAAGDDHLALAYSYHVSDPRWNNFTAVDARYRLTAYPGQNYLELFDHQNDPGETHNLARDPGHAERCRALHHALAEKALAHNAPIAGRISAF